MNLVVLGSSARAAAFSALRGGLSTAIIDQFLDRDALWHCPGKRLTQLARAGKPDLHQLLETWPNVPLMYTGGWENRPDELEVIASTRPVWGNLGEALRGSRCPFALTEALEHAGLPFATASSALPPDSSSSFLAKRFDSAGGSGVRAFDGDLLEQEYLQRRIPGTPNSAVFLGDSETCHLIGATRQLVGEPAFGAAPFAYCGSIGPVPLAEDRRRQLEAIGSAVYQRFELRGLFGLDLIDDGNFTAVEINPRYPASAEIYDAALNLSTVALHVAAFTRPQVSPKPRPGRELLGKAVVFATRDLKVGEHPTLAPPYPLRPRNVADIPHPGDEIPRGAPVLTVFAEGPSVEQVQRRLEVRAQQILDDLDRS